MVGSLMNTARKSRPKSERIVQNPWTRLALHGASAVVALVVGTISGSIEIMLVVLLLGAVATGFISEGTLIRLLPWSRRR